MGAANIFSCELTDLTILNTEIFERAGVGIGIKIHGRYDTRPPHISIFIIGHHFYLYLHFDTLHAQSSTLLFCSLIFTIWFYFVHLSTYFKIPKRYTMSSVWLLLINKQVSFAKSTIILHLRVNLSIIIIIKFLWNTANLFLPSMVNINGFFHWYELFTESDSAQNEVMIVKTVFLCDSYHVRTPLSTFCNLNINYEELGQCTGKRFSLP